jgi:hypothetical protein
MRNIRPARSTTRNASSDELDGRRGAPRRRGDPVWSLLANFLGACGILLSLLLANFNLSSTVMEGSWALVALAGLIRIWALKRRG